MDLITVRELHKDTAAYADKAVSIGGGIGQSRLCMLMIGNCHIGEVQASIWDAETMKQCEEAGIILL